MNQALKLVVIALICLGPFSAAVASQAPPEMPVKGMIINIQQWGFIE